MAVGGLVSEALVALLLYSFTYLVNSLASGQSFIRVIILLCDCLSWYRGYFFVLTCRTVPIEKF